MAVIIFFMAVAFSERSGLSFEHAGHVLDGSFAKANDVAITDAVVTSETTRLRMKERENEIIVTSGHFQPLLARTSPRPSLALPRYLPERSPNKRPSDATEGDARGHGGRTPGFSIKNQFAILNSLSFQLGERVRIRSGGPVMTVDGVKGNRVDHYWIDWDGLPISESFPATVRQEF